MAKKKKSQAPAATVETDVAVQSNEPASKPDPKTKVESQPQEVQSTPTLVICRNKYVCRKSRLQHCVMPYYRADVVVDIGDIYPHITDRG